MNSIFSPKDRQEAYDYILSITQANDSIVSLVQVGSGAGGFTDDRSDLDYVVALESDDIMIKVMEYMHEKISEKYEILYFSQSEAAHLQCYIFSNLLEVDLGYGGYEHAAARKKSFKVLYDNSGVVEDKMVKSLEWMNNSIFGDKSKKDRENACDSAWARMMHASVAINRNNYFRAIGEIDNLRSIYTNLLGDRYMLESGLYREMDKLPEDEKAALKSTFVAEVDRGALWTALLNLTELIYKELEECEVPISKEMIYEYYKGLR